MSAARKPTARPRRLVLVRGGLDGSHTGGGDGDWEDFCRRIGWQAPAGEPDDDFERRIQEGLLAIPVSPDDAVVMEGATSEGLSCPQSTSGVRLRPWLDEAEESGVEYMQSAVFEYRQSGVHTALGVLDVGAAAAADFGAVGAVDRPCDAGQSLARRGLVRAGIAAAALAVAAAAALAVTQLATSPAGSKAASIAAPAAERAHATATDAPERGEGPDAPLPLETGPSDNRPRATSAPTAEPAPGPTSPRVGPSSAPDATPVPPGMRVARRSLDDGATDFAAAEERVAERVARQPFSRDLRQPFSLPHDVRQSLPHDVRQSLPRDPREDGLAKWGSPRGFDAPSGEERPVMASLDAAGKPGTVADPAAMRAAAVRSLVAQPAAALAHRPAVAPAREPLPDVTLAAVDGGAAPSTGDGGDAWARVPAAARPAAPEGAGAANASWSLGGAKDRWVGASLAAPPPPLATSNIGVIVQLDLGKALGKL